MRHFFLRGQVLWLAFGWIMALVLIGLSAWSVEKTWIRPSMEVSAEGSAGRTQWGGMIQELRNPPRIFMDNDPYYWIAYARQMVEEGALRVRHTDLDNVPFGREVHWNSGFMIWLVICGAIAAVFTGQPMAQAIETGSLYADPALFIIVLALIGWWVMRRHGGIMAMGLVILLPALPAINWDFGYARPDHHGMHDAAALGMLLGLILGGCGWVRRDRLGEGKTAAVDGLGRIKALKAIRISAICGGIGLWIGATQQAFILGSAGLGLMVSLLWIPVGGLSADGLRFKPELLRTWGRWGCGTSLIFYLLEYFPNHMGMRLEVNHPLYALAWLGGSEILFQLAVWRISGQRPRKKNLTFLALGIVAVVLPALALGLGPAEWHAWHNEFMRRQHNYINEFEPLSHSLRDRGIWDVFARFGLLLLSVPVCLFLLLLKRITRIHKSIIALALAPVLVTGAMLCIQVRWAGLLSVALAVLALVLTRVIWSQAKGWPRARIAVGWGLSLVLLLPGLVMFFLAYKSSIDQSRSGMLDPVLAWTIASRDVAFNLKRIAAHEPVRVMSGPGQSPALHFFGGVEGTGSLYWENINGVRDAAAFFSDPGEDRAKEIVRRRGITHVVLEQSPSMAEQSCGIYYGGKNEKEIHASLAWRLADPLGKIPEWLEPIPYYGSPMAEQFQMRVYRVLPRHL